jgi:hypothetical protein
MRKDRLVEKKRRTPGSSRWVLNLTDKIPSGTSASPSSAVSPKVETILCLSLRLSELRKGADVFRSLRDFLNMVVAKCLVSILHHELEQLTAFLTQKVTRARTKRWCQTRKGSVGFIWGTERTSLHLVSWYEIIGWRGCILYAHAIQWTGTVPERCNYDHAWF